MNKEKELTLTEDQIKIERGSLQLNSSSLMRSTYLNINNEGSDSTDGADADGTDGTGGVDTDGTDGADADGADSSDADGTDKRI